MACINLDVSSIELPEVLNLIAQVKNHPAWNDSLTYQEIEEKLKQSSHYSYFLTSSEEESIYLLFFLGKDEAVHRHPVTIVAHRDGWMGFKNGAMQIYETIDELIPYSMGCTAGACHPCK